MDLPKSHFAYRWALLRRRKGEPEQLLASGHAETMGEARAAVIRAERAFPVAWLPEVYYVIRDAQGFDQEEANMAWLPVSEVN